MHVSPPRFFTSKSKAFAVAALWVASSNTVHAISFEQVDNNLLTSSQFIDCRDSNYFNGWSSAKDKQGGHLPGAKSFDSRWLTQLASDQALEAKLKLLKLDKSVTTYLYGEEQATAALQSRLSSVGFQHVEVITGDINAYSGKRVSLANYDKLVPSWWVNDLNQGKAVSHPPSANYKIVEVAWGMPKQYLMAHIPGAIYLDTNSLEEAPLWNVVSDKQLHNLLGELGIRSDTSVILYGRNNMAAARAANIMMYAGVRDVRLINGGWSAWQDYPSESMLNSPTAVTFDVTVPQRPELISSLTQAQAMLAQPDDASLVSIRTWDEYIGETSGYSYIEAKGRITGSKWGRSGLGANSLEAFRNLDHTMIDPAIIEEYWRPWSIDSKQDVAFYCGTGWRASEVFFYAHVMGWPSISVFDGGWYEWSSNVERPTESGQPFLPSLMVSAGK